MKKQELKNYYQRLTAASNTVCILGNINIDHFTITGFMNTKEKMQHLLNLEDRAARMEMPPIPKL